MSVGFLRKLLYRMGWLAPYWTVDRFRYLKRLSRTSDDWRYLADGDARQYNGKEVVARITGIAPPVFFYCDHGSLIEVEILKKGAFQREILELGNDLITPGSAILDVGANIGAYALPWAACHPDVVVHCFEPHPQVRLRLGRNILLNGLADRVQASSNALSDRNGGAVLHAVDVMERNQGLSTLGEGVLSASKSDRIEVSTQRIDDLQEIGERKISLVKIDVQGHELEVLRGGTETLARHRPALLLEHEDVLCATPEEALNRKEQTGRLLSNLGYETFYVSRWGADLLMPVDWSRQLNGDLLALPLDRMSEISRQ